jgi:hypothetical protein
MPPEPTPRPLLQRLLWFVLLWLIGVATIALLSLLLQLWLAPQGAFQPFSLTGS